MDTQSFSRKSLILLILAVLAGIAGAFWWYTYTNISNNENNEKLGSYSAFLDKNQEFATGEQLLRSQKYAEAAEYFERALASATNSWEEGQLKYKYAIAISEGGEPLKGIPLLKQIVANDKYTRILHAYAVQYLGHLLYAFNTPAVHAEVFAGEPYERFASSGDAALARRQLFEYASSFYPLGIPELRVAKWYSTEVIRLKKEGAKNDILVNNMKNLIRERLAHADAYIEEITDNPNTASYIPEVLYRKGSVLGDLYLAGDTSFGDPEDSFKASILRSGAAVGLEAAAKYTYASYLAKMYGKDRSADIKNLLSDFYTSDKYVATNMYRQIRNEKENLLGQKESILRLASIDKSFAALLTKLGWPKP